MITGNTCRIKNPYSSIVKISNEGIIKVIQIAASKYAKGELIDIGCGTKPYEAIFQPHINSYFGIDYESSAESNYSTDTKADLFIDCTNTGLEKETYDTLLSTQVMEHIYDTASYVKECHRLLKKGGYGIFTVPMSWRCHGEPYDFYRFTKYSLEKIFKENGFLIIELKEIEGTFATIIQHFIVFLANRQGYQNIIFRIARKSVCSILFSIMNFTALKLDRFFWDEKLCLNYILVVKKV